MSAQRNLRRLAARPALWIMCFGALAIYGLHALASMPAAVLPRFDFPLVSVTVHARDTSVQAMEARIVRPLESRILALPGLVGVRSTIGHGSVQIHARFVQGSLAQTDLQAVNGAIDRARGDLPAQARPYAQIMGNAINEVADYVASIPAGVDPANVQRIVKARIVPMLRALDGVQRVEVYGAGEPALWVQPDLASLRAHDVPIGNLLDTLHRTILLEPAGYLAQGYQDVDIQLDDQPRTAASLGMLPIPGPNGPIPLRDLAHVTRAAMPVHNAVLLDGRPGVALTVLKQPDASTVPVTRGIQRTLAASRDMLPTGVHWVRIYDQGHMVHLIGSDLGRNLLIGGALAILALFWMLGASKGIGLLAISIPLSLLVAVGGLYATGHSLNMMTLGALTVAVGLVADDAIVVLEAIHHRREAGAAGWSAVRQGLGDIASPDISGSLTTVSVFLPLLFVGGLASLFFVPFAWAMTLAILASLLVSLTLIPLGLGGAGTHAGTDRPAPGARWLERMRGANAHILDWMLRRPRRALAACVGLLLVSGLGLALVPMHLLPLPNEGVLLESFSLPPGTSLQQTRDTVTGLTRRLREDPAVAHTFTRIGSASDTAYVEPAYGGEIQIALKPGIHVNSLDGIARRLLRASREDALQAQIDTPTTERLGESLNGLPQPFVIHVFGRHLHELRVLSQRIAQRLRALPQFSDVFANDGYPVNQLRILPHASTMASRGIDTTQLQAQLRPLLAGSVVARVLDGNLPLDIYVRLARATRLSLRQLRALPIHDHGWTPLGQLAEVRLVATPNQLRHVDGERALDVLATPSTTIGRAVAASRKALAGLKLPPGYRIAYGGLFPQLIHTVERLGMASLLALMLMAGILLLQFDGLRIPALVLLQVPLALTGGALALVVSGVGLNAMGLVGFLTLIGLSLNHGIVLLYRARRNERDGMAPEAAVREAVHARFRPIVLTTLTAVLGTLPTALGWGQGAAPEQGLAIVILGGMLWSALLTTNLLPALYLHAGRRHAAAAAAPV